MPYLGNQHIVGDSVHNFKVLDDISSYTETFDGSASSVVSTSDETIRVVNHRFVQGQRVTYNNGGGGNIGGLSSGTAYYVTYDSASTIKLATTLANANNNTNINLTSVGSGSAHTLTAAFDGVNKKFRITHDGGTRARFSQASQLRIAINNVIQKANNDHLNFSEGYAIDVRSIIVFQTAPTVNDIFFGDLLGETLGTFDVSDHKIDNHTGDGSTVEFSLSRNVPNVQSLLVTLDGVLQHASDATTSRAYSLIADNIIQFTGAPASGVQIQIRHLGFAGASTGEVSGFYGRTGNVTLGVTDNISIGDISTSRNINATGIVTASSFVGDGSGLIGVASTDNIVTGTAATFNTYPVDINAGMTVAGVSTFQDIDVDGHTNLDNVNVAGVVTFASAVNMGTLTASTGSFSGNVTIGGTLTYEDVTNIDSVGVVTARNGLNVLTGTSFFGGPITAAGAITGTASTATNVTVADESSDTACYPLFVTTNTGNLPPKVGTNLTFNSSSGALTATSFSGDGSALTSLNGSQITSGTVPVARIGTGTKNTSTFYRGDGTFATVTPPAITAINSASNNRIVTSDGGTTVTAESSFTIDGTSLSIAGAKDIRFTNGGWTGEYAGKIQHHANFLYMQGGSSGFQFRSSGGSDRLIIDSNGHVIPAADNSYNLGSLTQRWANIYTADLKLSNKGSKNDVDNTWGDYTIQEGESDLFLINNRSGKKYKFNLTEVS